MRLGLCRLLAAAVATCLMTASAMPAPADAAQRSGYRKLLVADVSERAGFGGAISVSGHRAAVIASDDTDAVADLQNDNLLCRRSTFYGSVHIHERKGHAWERIAKLRVIEPPQPPYGCRNLASVAISGTTVVVGSNQENGATYWEGTAYVFEQRPGPAGEWHLVKTLVSPDPITYGEFGFSVAIRKDTIVVGQPTGHGIGGYASAAYVFHRDAGGRGNWGLSQKLVPDDIASLFGWSLALAGDELAVGAGPNLYAEGEGAAYVFRRDAKGQWTRITKVTASDRSLEDAFGVTVALDGDTLVVGGPSRAAAAGPGFDDGGRAGAMYVFQRDQGGPDHWGEVARLAPPDPNADLGSGFGLSAATLGDVILVGAAKSDQGAGADAGATYAFGRDVGGTGRWGFAGVFQPDDAAPGDNFGGSIVAAGSDWFIGAPGVDEAGDGKGAVYVIDAGALATALPESSGVVLGGGLSPTVLLALLLAAIGCDPTSRYRARRSARSTAAS